MLTAQTIPLNKKVLAPLIYDYLSGKEELKPFYTYFPDKSGFKKITEAASYGSLNRQLLADELKRQAVSVKNTPSASLKNIELLKDANTFTVTTGHQLCLFTGPLYFIYKIFSVINLCERLKQDFPGKNFIPVYWLAGEDHDAEEINHFYVFGKKISWETTQTGAVGHFSTAGLDAVYNNFKEILGEKEQAAYLLKLFEQSYLGHSNLKDATRYLVNELFSEYGLVIVDSDSAVLKKQFGEIFRKDIFENIPFQKVNGSISKLEKSGYEPQVNPREINCFYLDKNLRARLERENDKYRVVGTEKVFSKSELEGIIESSPEKLSPNVVLRPVYQQFILPNIAYVGGPGELSYWMEYRSMFEALDVTYPVLVPRHSVIIADKPTLQKSEKLGFKPEDFFADEQELIKLFLERSNKTVALESYKNDLSALFEKISSEATAVDATLKSTVEAETKKSLNSIDIIEQKINRAIKQRSETELTQLKTIKSKLFPNNVPHERVDNFAMFYMKWNGEFFKELKDSLKYNLEEMGQVLLIEQ